MALGFIRLSRQKIAPHGLINYMYTMNYTSKATKKLKNAQNGLNNPGTKVKGTAESFQMKVPRRE